MVIETVVAASVSVIAGVGVGYAFYQAKKRALVAELGARERDLAEKRRLETVTERLAVESSLRAAFEMRASTLERELAARRQEVFEEQARLIDRESAVTRQMDRLGEHESSLRERSTVQEVARASVERERADLIQQRTEHRARLESLSRLTAAEARQQFLKQIELDSTRDAADLTRHILDEARLRSEMEAHRILATALQRFAAKHTFESSTATVALTGDDMKGRIIGRDGRNIRAFEAATGVTVLVDDTPNAVVLSGFDPIRREIARQSMERLILDGRIHPTRIEEVVASVRQEMDAFIVRAGEDALFRAGVAPVHPEVVKVLGKLHFRHSFSQNVLEHSIEVAHLCGLMAAELGEDVVVAKRAGLLHDIGKAVSHEIEGPHAIVGANLLKLNGESPVIVNAVASHHHEVPHENLFGILVNAGDAISASRPGSRSESMTTHLQRLDNLEQIALEFDGVEKAFAVQAGRELRVIVRPEALDDAASLNLARQLARRVEQEMNYPGQIRITVTRETRCVEYAK
ncbi:MAG: ribonuclease Y [Pedosphaera sp.]|nr:ribonuclease Y [Pedosphaera sp.]